MASPFDDLVILDWFFFEKNWNQKYPDGIVTAGSGPFDEQEFDDFLRTRGLELYPLETDIDTLVIGRENWNPTALEKHLQVRKGQVLHVYSQEMFLALMKNRADFCYQSNRSIDPYEDNITLMRFAQGHPAFKYLSDLGFKWPTTNIVPARGDGRGVNPATWPNIGLLKHMGYSTGNNGAPTGTRRSILQSIFFNQVPNVLSQSHMNEWGTPNSSSRLCKLANTIAAHARNAKRRTDPPCVAIQDWEDDLAWLKVQFYDGRFDRVFPWPSTL